MDTQQLTRHKEIMYISPFPFYPLWLSASNHLGLLLAPNSSPSWIPFQSQIYVLPPGHTRQYLLSLFYSVGFTSLDNRDFYTGFSTSTSVPFSLVPLFPSFCPFNTHSKLITTTIIIMSWLYSSAHQYFIFIIINIFVSLPLPFYLLLTVSHSLFFVFDEQPETKTGGKSPSLSPASQHLKREKELLILIRTQLPPVMLHL